jgi:hypothetical protein
MWTLLLTIEPMTPGRTAGFLFGLVVAWLVYSFLYTMVDRAVEKLAEVVEFVRVSSPYAERRQSASWEGFDHHELLARGRITRSP